jgi:thiosulfate/3-mercaptopyruvate sulfurtransferase
MIHPLISTAELAGLLGSQGLLILDASVELHAAQHDGDYRVESGYRPWLAQHLPASRHADLLDELTDPEAAFSFALVSPERLGPPLARLGLFGAQHVVIYDRHDGFWAARLWWLLRSLGITARVLDGGLKAWLAAALPVESGESPPLAWSQAPALQLDSHLWADREQVLAVVEGRAPGLLVCALSQALFDGQAVTRYARRGHIPGSLCRPARSLFDENGRYLPPAQLAEVLGAALLEDSRPLILYCGGGISAAATALALTLLGRAPVAIYDGSLQEWAADRCLPMTTGAAPA